MTSKKQTICTTISKYVEAIYFKVQIYYDTNNMIAFLIIMGISKESESDYRPEY